MKVIELTDKEFQIIMWALQAFREQKKEDISRRSFAKWYAVNNPGGWVPGTENRGVIEDISIMEHLENRLKKQTMPTNHDDLDFEVFGEGWGTPYGEPSFEVENDWEVTPHGEQLHHLDRAIDGQEEDYEEEIDLYKTWGGD